MTPDKLDFIFPFVVLGYGALMTFVLNAPGLSELAEQRLPTDVYRQLIAHRSLSLVCLVIGALWTLQNLWL
jgi:hypothetical protein